MGRILVCSDSPFLNTGFGNVGRFIAQTLHDAGHQVFHLAFFDPRPREDMNRWAGRHIPWTVLNAGKPPRDEWAQESIGRILLAADPELIILVADLWNIEHILSNAPCPTVVLAHIEAAPLPTKIIARRDMPFVPKILLKSSMVVTPGPFARKVIQDRMKEYLTVNPETSLQNVLKNTDLIIPDVVDTNVFRPLPDKLAIRREMFRDLLPPDVFLIGYFGRQNPRKGLPYALKALQQWTDKPDNVFMYLHTATKDRAGWNLNQLLVDTRTGNKVVIDPHIKVGGGCSEEVLNMLYNCCDVNLLPTSGEGAGITLMEAASATVPSVTTNYSELVTYVGDVAELVDPVGYWIEPGTNIERAIPDVEHMVRRLKKLHRDPNYRKALGVRARAKMVTHFDPKVVAPQWLKLTESMLKAKVKAHPVTQVKRGDKKVVCFFGSYYVNDLIGGGELTHHRILQEFMKRGWEAHAFVAREGITDEILEVDGVKVMRVGRVGADRQISKFMENLRPDVVIHTAIDVSLSRAGFAAAKGVGATTIYYEQFYNMISKKYENVMDLPPEESAPWGKEILSLVDHVYANGPFVQAALQKHQQQDSKILHPYLNLADYVASARVPEYVTMINPDRGKGGETLADLIRQMPNTKFLVVKISGKGDYRAFAEVQDLPNVTLMEFQKDPRVIYSQTKILLVPTVVDETFCRVILEAQANGIPVVARDVGGIKNTMGAGGILIPKRTETSEWVSAIQGLLEDQAHYDRLSAAALENTKRFDFDAEISRFIDEISKARTDAPVRKARVNCITPPWAGVQGVFHHLAKVVPDSHVYQIAGTTTSKAIIDAVIAARPEKVIFGAWLPQYMDAIRAIKKTLPETKIIMGFFSSFSQMEFSTNNEVQIFNGLVTQTLPHDGNPPLVDEIWMSSENEVPMIQKGFNGVTTFPCPISIEAPRVRKPSDKLRLSLFCTPGPRKNIAAQLLAVSKVPNHELHLNGISQKPEYAITVKRLGLNCVDHGWMDREAYLQMVANMDIGLQVTFTETFNYVIADHFMMGTPVVSTLMNPLIAQDPSLHNMAVLNAHDPEAIYQKIMEVAAQRDTAGLAGRTSLLLLADKNNDELKRRLLGAP